jgi:hypothetical protein
LVYREFATEPGRPLCRHARNRASPRISRAPVLIDLGVCGGPLE